MRQHSHYDKLTRIPNRCFCVCPDGMFSSLPRCLIAALSLYLCAVKWGGQRKSRRQRNCGGKNGSKYTIIELNCAPGLLQACVVLEGRTHTHTHTDKWGLAFGLSHHCRHSDKPLWFHMPAPYVIVMPVECLLAPDSTFLIACLLSVCVCVCMCVCVCAHCICLCTTPGSCSHFWAFTQRGRFQPNVHPPVQTSLFFCVCEWLHRWEGCLLPPPLIPPSLPWAVCMIVTLECHHTSSKNLGDSSWSLCALDFHFYLRALGIYSNPGSHTEPSSTQHCCEEESICDQYRWLMCDMLLVHCMYNEAFAWLCFCFCGPAAADKRLINACLVIIFQDCFHGSPAPGAKTEIKLAFLFFQCSHGAVINANLGPHLSTLSPPYARNAITLDQVLVSAS